MLDFMKNNRKRIIALLVAVFLFVPSFSLIANAKPVSKRIVKIGYYENDNFQSGASDSEVKSGYAYEYCQKLQIYTNWKYEYVYGEYGNLYKALEDGEIDMLAGIAYKEERVTHISYPELSMGDITYYFIKRTDDDSVTNKSQSFNGKKIGTLTGAMKSLVDSYIEENGIEAKVVEFSDINSRDYSLISGETDIILVEGETTKAIDGTEPVFSMGESEVFICVAKNRPDILSELNIAQNSMYEANPLLKDTLGNKWYKQNIISTALSDNEKKWVDNHKVFKVGYYTHCAPFASTDKYGNATGVMVDVLPEMFRQLRIDDIEIQYIGYDTFDELSDALQGRDIDISCPAYVDYWASEKNNIATSEAFVNSYFDVVYKGDYPDMENAVFAIQRSNKLIQAYKDARYTDNRVVYCDSIFDCLDAIVSGKADVTVLGNYSADSLLKTKNRYAKLSTAQLPEEVPLGFAVERSDSDTLEVLNHGIWLLDSYYAESMLYKYYETPKVTVRELISQNAVATVVVAIVIVIAIIIATVLELRKNRIFLEKEEKQKEELETKVQEITELNEKLEENQARLEESICQQDAQIQEITALNTQLEDNQNKLEEQIDIVRSMGKIYFSSYYIDINADTFVELLSKNNIREAVGVEGDAQKTLYKMCGILIQPEYIDEMREFVDLSTLDDRFRLNNVVTCEFKGVTIGWSQAYFIEGDRDENGRLLHTFFATRMIHVEKAREEEQKRVLEEAKAKAEAANNAKTAFLFNMSHDIRTPMNAIMGFRDLLEKNQENPEKRREYLHKIDSASNVLLSIINNVLEMARIEKGAMDVEETAWSTEQFTDTLYSVFEDMMKKKNIEFVRNIHVEHPFIFCDPIKLREIFLNIISNAYKYTPEGGRVSIDVEELPCEIDGWVLYRTTISDTGIGMSEEYLPHVFEEFSRENNTTDTKIEGTGLGMSIVKRLVDLLNGTIEATSKKGEGSSFVVTIPHRIAKRSDLVDHMGIEYDPKLFEGKRVLLVEDNELNSDIVIEILNESGFMVEHASDGTDCIKMVEDAAAGYYDVILMDIQMPQMNGYEATRKIRTMEDYDKATIPILAMTANAFAEDKREAMRVGMNGHLAKPIDVQMMLKEIARVLIEI